MHKKETKPETKWKEKDPHGSKLWSPFYALLFAERSWKKN